MKPAIGCTEPVAVALASAIAYQAIAGKLEAIRITVSPALFKTSLSCVVPESVVEAYSWLSQGTVEIALKERQTGLYVDVVVRTNKGVGRAVIKDTHTNIALVEANGEIIHEKEKKEGKKQVGFNISRLQIADLTRFVEEVPFEDIEFVLDAVKMNQALAEDGLTEKFGMAVGANMLRLVEEQSIANDLITAAQILVASACEERLARAIALSLLITIYIKAYSGRLSAFCGCAVTAASGASAGIVYLLGGSNEQIGHAIKNMAADITGLLCDGGDFGCALKTSTGAGAAVRAAFFALKGIVIPAGSGIVARSVEETIQNVGRISSPGMVGTDTVVLDIMTKN